ncbi:hypothetical protein PSTG_16837 [Puccinia striiformis f. sp. tritici PST-78]|uniref:Retrotransposon gag domain-containing protein n=1 Tax=Puccinia striiformis f. sp. tritici PST-78 TaxID=1165861 RepID=A0A0L0URI7_9BASI|nr:hypothetical protein PSTG_16837 [Puccinia striiformis f. sp. tritici PST-78]
MSNTRSTGNSLLPLVDPEALLRTAAAERHRLSKTVAINSATSIHVPATPAAPPSTSINIPSASYPSTSFHTPATSPPGTPADPPTDLPFTPSLLRANSMADSPINPPSGGADPPKDPTTPKKTDSAKGGGSSSSKSASKNPIADHYVELLLKLQHTAAMQLQEERQLNIEQRHADRSLHDIEPFLKWITQLEIFFSTKGVIHDDDKVSVAGRLLENTRLLDFYVTEGPTYLGKSWAEFKTRLFEVALPQRWRNTLRTKLRLLVMGPKESFISFSGRARTLQTLINFDIAASSSSPAPATPPSTQLSDFDLAEFVTLGRVAVFDEFTVRPPAPRPTRGVPNSHSPSNSPPDPIAWRVHAYLDSQGQCHHCKTTCGSAPGACTKPLNKRWVDIPDTFQTPRRPVDYKPPQAHGSSSSTAGKPTHPPAGRPPHWQQSPNYVDVVDAIDEDHQAFVDATADKDLPPDLTSADWAIFREIDAIRSDNVAVVEEDASSRVRGRFTGRLYATRPTAQTLAETLSTVLLRHLKLPTMYS